MTKFNARDRHDEFIKHHANRYYLRQFLGSRRWNREEATTLAEARRKARAFPAGRPVGIYAVADELPGWSADGTHVENVKPDAGER